MILFFATLFKNDFTVGKRVLCEIDSLGRTDVDRMQKLEVEIGKLLNATADEHVGIRL